MIHYIVNVEKRQEYKLIIKGLIDLYDIKKCIATNLSYLNIAQDEIDNLFKNNIVLITEAVSFERMNNIYNMVDLCVSPYLCEGFNLTPLEALATGTCVVVPRTGSTKEYIEDIYSNGGLEYIYYVESKIVDMELGKVNDINTDDLIKVVLSFTKRERYAVRMVEYINHEYSWFKVVDLLYDYFLECSR
jgi:glycosyltransferase involved in cell wall biosynthesis